MLLKEEKKIILILSNHQLLDDKHLTVFVLEIFYICFSSDGIAHISTFDIPVMCHWSEWEKTKS